MEGKEEEFDIFQNVDEEDFFYFDAFPFNNDDEQVDSENLSNLIFPWVDNNYDPFSGNENHKNFMDCDTLLEKITKCEENYNNILKSSVIDSATSSKI